MRRVDGWLSSPPYLTIHYRSGSCGLGGHCLPSVLPFGKTPAEKQFVAKTEPIEMDAVVTTALPNAMFKLKLDGAGDREILGIVSGKMRKHFIRILPGDRVKVELSPYDLTKGRIVFRQK